MDETIDFFVEKRKNSKIYYKKILKGIRNKGLLSNQHNTTGKMYETK